MSERELRDRVEALYDELKKVRAELEVPEHQTTAATRTTLLEEIAALEAREAELIERLPELMKKIKFTRQAADVAEKNLREARSRVAEREDLGNPLAESRSNWEDQSQPPGCNLGVLLFATFAALALAAGWWS
jgi:hypothetical protein